MKTPIEPCRKTRWLIVVCILFAVLARCSDESTKPTETDNDIGPRTDSLVALWLLDGNAEDSSGNGFNGIVHGARPAPDRFGQSSAALNFDGFDDLVLTPCTGVLGTAARTISLWAKHATTFPPSGVMTYLTYGNGPSGGTFMCIARDGEVGTCLSNVIKTFSVPASDTNWHHLVWVLPDLSRPTLNDVQVFRDGSLLTAVAYTYHDPAWALNTVSGQPVSIGYHPEWAFAGSLDNIALFNRALGTSEIDSLYQETH